MNKPLLSICIPTYNRAHYLEDCLDIIVCQFDEKEIFSQTEIVISDNASEDNTQELVREYQKEFPNIRYFRNPTNLGFDRNVDRVISEAKGMFCWTLSDDDYLQDRALKFVIKTIKENPALAYILIDLKKGNQESSRYYQTGNELFKEEKKVFGGLISQNLFKKEFIPIDRRKYYDNLWFHLSLIMEMIVGKPVLVIKNLFLPQKYRLARFEKGGYNFFTYLYLRRIVKNLANFGYDQKIVEKIVKSFGRGLPRVVASARIRGLEISRDNLKILNDEFLDSPFWLLVANLIFFIPTFYLKFLKHILSYVGITKR